MFKALCFLLLLFSFACENESTLHRTCPLKCWPDGIKKPKMIGECHYGKPVCDDQGNVLECTDYGSPTLELCDGLDNDCDGRTDEDFDSMRSEVFKKRHEETNIKSPCPPNLGVCVSANVTCVSGTPSCNLPINYEKEEKSCDSLDNDCDGRIDEDLFINEFCFDDEFWKATNPPCHPGTKSCLNGSIMCVNQQLPRKEICDDLDNDCNGYVNDFGDDPALYDFVFSVDMSGSMIEEINAVKTALFEFSALFEKDDKYRFALVELSSGFYEPSLVSDFLNYEDFTNLLTGLTTTNTGNEWALDSIYNICDLENNKFALSWRDDSYKYVFTFTDEELRSHEGLNTLRAVGEKCLEHQVRPYNWVIQSEIYNSEIITNINSTITYPLSYKWEIMFEQLESLFAGLCTK